MNKLEQLIKESDYTQEEWKIFQKVEKHNQLEDLLSVLNEKLELGIITEKQYKFACDNADWIIEKYNDYETDWQTAMDLAIDYVIEDL